MMINKLARTCIVWASFLVCFLTPVAWANSSSSSNSIVKTHAVADMNRGKALYMANCIACHNKDPNKKGSMGPELVGTPIEVFNIKVVTGNQYPNGYIPKRKTKIMKKLPKLEKDIPHIFAWIQSVALPAAK